jgi:hypothetical protein
VTGHATALELAREAKLDERRIQFTHPRSRDVGEENDDSETANSGCYRVALSLQPLPVWYGSRGGPRWVYSLSQHISRRV